MICGEGSMISSRRYGVAGILCGDNGTAGTGRKQIRIYKSYSRPCFSPRISDEEKCAGDHPPFSKQQYGRPTGIRIPLHLYGILTGEAASYPDLTHYFCSLMMFGQEWSVVMFLSGWSLAAGADVWILNRDWGSALFRGRFC